MYETYPHPLDPTQEDEPEDAYDPADPEQRGYDRGRERSQGEDAA